MRRKRGRGRLRRLRAGLVTPLPGGLGSPSVPTTRDCLEWLDAARTKAGESLPDRVEPKAARVRARKNGPEDLKSRDGAPRGAHPSPRVPALRQARIVGCAAWRSIPSALSEGLKGDYGAPRAAQIIGACKRARLEQGRWRLAV